MLSDLFELFVISVVGPNSSASMSSLERFEMLLDNAAESSAGSSMPVRTHNGKMGENFYELLELSNFLTHRICVTTNSRCSNPD